MGRFTETPKRRLAGFGFGFGEDNMSDIFKFNYR
jgi:hypothetical protein